MVPPCFPEPENKNLAYGRYSDPADQVKWLDRSTLPHAKRARAFLNRALDAFGAETRERLCHRLHHDPPFERVFFELVVGRFLQELGADVEYQPVGLDTRNVDWRATFRGGDRVLVEATSPAYNQVAEAERRRRERLIGVVEDMVPTGWWVIPRRLPAIGRNDSSREFRRVIRSLFNRLPEDPVGVSFANRLVVTGQTARGAVMLELWPGDPTGSPIAMASMGAYRDDSELRVAQAVRKKRHQARAFPGERVLLAINAPWGGPDREQFDTALLGHSVMHLGLDYMVTHYSFRRDGALAVQRSAEYAAVLAFKRVSLFGASDPVVYRHPRYRGELPAEVLALRQRYLDREGIANVDATRVGIAEGIGFPPFDE